MRLRHLLFPLSQLACAGITLIAWLVIARLTETQAQEVAISSYALGVPASLVATLGIAYVLPNTFRTITTSSGGTAGPWSKPLRIAVITSAAVCGVGIFLSFLPLSFHRLAVAAATLSMAGTIAAGVTVAQIGRTTNRLWLAVAGQCAVPLTAGAWLAAIHIGGTDEIRVRTACLLMAAALAILIVPMRPYVGRYPTDTEYFWRLARAAVVLLPHLLLFGIIVQGARFISVIGGDGRYIEQAHVLMLGVSVGLTLLASINTYVAPNLQAMSEEAYPLGLKRALIVFVLAGVCAVIAVSITLLIFRRFSLLSDVTPKTHLYVVIALLSVGTYYSISTQCMRHLRTGALTIASGAGATTLVVPSIFGAGLPFEGLVGNFSASTLILLWTMTLLALRYRAHIRLSLTVPFVLSAIWLIALLPIW